MDVTIPCDTEGSLQPAAPTKLDKGLCRCQFPIPGSGVFDICV